MKTNSGLFQDWSPCESWLHTRPESPWAIVNVLLWSGHRPDSTLGQALHTFKAKFLTTTPAKKRTLLFLQLSLSQ